MRLILVRHGETEYNADGLTLGRHDAPLNERGRAQADALAASFRDAPAAIYSSPLERAVTTAQKISEQTGVAFEIEPGLIEMDVGELEHLTRDQLRTRHPEFLRRWLSGEVADARMPGGEALRDVQDRAWNAVERIHDAHPMGDVVAVTHNFVILSLVCRSLNLPLAEFRHLRQALAAKTVIDVRDGATTLLQLNDNAHVLDAGVGDELMGREVRA